MGKDLDLSQIKILFVIIFIPLFLYAQYIPESPRSRRAINQVRPKLERELHEKNLKWGAPVFIRIFKKFYILEIWLKDENKYRKFKEYNICTYGGNGLGPKLRQGDCKAPEGFYYATPRQLNPNSNFYLAINIGYPNRYDRVHHRTGSAIMIHGDRVSIGCFAMGDENIKEIYALIDAAFRNGQKFIRIHIFPFRMIEENLERYKNNRWYEFWKNLKEGYDYFEKYHVPPNVEVREGRYIFN